MRKKIVLIIVLFITPRLVLAKPQPTPVSGHIIAKTPQDKLAIRLRQRKGYLPLPLSVSTAATERLQGQMDRWADHLQQHVQWNSIASMVGLRI